MPTNPRSWRITSPFSSGRLHREWGTRLLLRTRVVKVPFGNVLGLVLGRVRTPEFPRSIRLVASGSIGVAAFLTVDLPVVGVLRGGHPVASGAPGPAGTQGSRVWIMATERLLSGIVGGWTTPPPRGRKSIQGIDVAHAVHLHPFDGKPMTTRQRLRRDKRWAVA